MGAVTTKTTLMVTGAGGYIGQALVKLALQQGHAVKAVLRPGRDVPADLDGAVVVFADLVTDKQTLVDALQGVDVVLHAAGSFSSDHAKMIRDTIEASESVLDAMSVAGVPRCVLIGSMAVYRYDSVEKIDEYAALETHLDQRDTYCEAKSAQEKLFHDKANLDVTVLRVGAVWGPDRLFNAHLGVGLGPFLLRIGKACEVPICHIDTCVSAALIAATAKVEPDCSVINVLDDDRPNAPLYLNKVRQCGWPRVTLPVPLFLLMVLARVLPPSLRRVGLLKPATLAARFGSVRFSNKRLHQCLEGVTMVSFVEAMKNAISKSRGPKP